MFLLQIGLRARVYGKKINFTAKRGKNAKIPSAIVLAFTLLAS
jgi:hypothetical protein